MVEHYYGATTLSITTFRIKTLSITILSIMTVETVVLSARVVYAQWHLC